MQRKILTIICLVILIVGCFGIFWLLKLQKAHSTFDNYYAFRGCVTLIEKTDTYGTCKLSSGEIIKIIKIGNKWYLDGDGPGIW